MPEDIRIWEILEGDRLREIEKAKLDLEERLQNWLEKDISIISNDLLVIGREVTTEFGGAIDLLCLDHNGDIVVVELKRGKTPREITAQALDYASWVIGLSNERITEIANRYLAEKGSLEIAFERRFGTELPEILNESHKMLIVASEIDSSSERIIKYLSDSHGVGINAVTFQHFRNEGGSEFLARVFLIEPSQVEYRAQTRGTSKREPPLTYEELQEIAERQGVGDLFERLLAGLTDHFDQRTTTRSSVAFIGIMDGSRNTIFSLLPGRSNAEQGLLFQVYIDRFTEYFGVEKQIAVEALPSYEKTAIYEDWAGEFGKGFFREETQAESFLAKLSEFRK